MPQILNKSVGPIGFGLMSVFKLREAYGPLPDEEAFKVMKAALNNGCNFWIGAEFFGPPENTFLNLVNRYFTKYPEDAEKVVLSIKGCFSLTHGPECKESDIRRHVDNCLAVLNGKKFLDAFEPARLDSKISVEETVRVLASYVKEGKVGGILLSEVRADTIRRARKIHPISGIEMELSLWATETMRDGVAETCAELGIPVISYSPIAQGMFSGALTSLDDLPRMTWGGIGPVSSPAHSKPTSSFDLRLSSAIFLATSKTGLPVLGSWTNEGIVISATPANGFNGYRFEVKFFPITHCVQNIRPCSPSSLLIDGNKWYLSLGSFWTGIKLFELDPKTGKTLSASPIASLAKRTANSGALEASIVFKYGQYYYNFNPWDNCCMGEVMRFEQIARTMFELGGLRASPAHTPYVDQEGTPLLQGGGSRVLLGSHDFDILMDMDGPIILYHYYATKGSFIGMNKLSFTDGWPEIA